MLVSVYSPNDNTTLIIHVHTGLTLSLVLKWLLNQEVHVRKLKQEDTSLKVT